MFVAKFLIMMGKKFNSETLDFNFDALPLFYCHGYCNDDWKVEGCVS